MDIGDAKLTLKVEGEDKVNSALNNVGKSLEKMSGNFKKAGLAMMGAGTALVGGLVALTIKTSAAGDAIAKMSQRTGLGTVALSELKYAADLSGASLEELEVGIKVMQRTLIDAGDGLSTATMALEKLNITVAQLKRMPHNK